MKFLFFYFLSFYLSFLECSWNILSSSSTTTIIGVNTILEGSSLSATSLISIGASVQRYNGKYFKYDSSILGPLLFDVAGYDNITITGILITFLFFLYLFFLLLTIFLIPLLSLSLSLTLTSSLFSLSLSFTHFLSLYFNYYSWINYYLYFKRWWFIISSCY